MLDADDWFYEAPPTLKGEVFVSFDWTPANKATEVFIQQLAERVGLSNYKGQTLTQEKIKIALSGFVIACTGRFGGYICWSMNANAYAGEFVGYRIATEVLAAIVKHDLLKKIQGPEYGRAAIWQVNFPVPNGLRFKEHEYRSLIEVRATPEKKGKKGKQLSLKKFDKEEVELREAEMATINAMLAKNPLYDSATGLSYNRCRRVFNNGSLSSGGRLIGRWQSLKSEKRLAMTINGNEVCEIDTVSSFLYVANCLTGNTMVLERDPFASFSYVQQQQTNEERKLARKAVKLFTIAFLCNGQKMTRWPDLEQDKETRVEVGMNEKFNIPNYIKPHHWVRELKQKWPFLIDCNLDAGQLMIKESTVLTKALLTLAEKNLVGYGIHDCILCPTKDKEEVVEAYQLAMIDVLGSTAYLEIEQQSREKTLVEQILP